MIWLLAIVWLLPAQGGAVRASVDVSRLEVGAPNTVAEVDLGSLKGELRRLAWSPDGSTIYLLTVEGKPPKERLHHWVMLVSDGTIEAVPEEPDWAAQYWAVKQDRTAPGLPSLQIAVSQAIEKVKVGTGPAGVLDRTSDPSSVAMNGVSAENLANGQHGDQRANVVRLSFADVEIARFINEQKPVPGLQFGWGPSGSGTMVFVTEQGSLTLLDQKKRKQPLADSKNALLPAWSTDGQRLAYLQKTGRKTWAVIVRNVDW